jgi:hypothetical protein
MSTDTGNGQLWILLPWTLFALAVAIKFWQITNAIRQNSLKRPSTERFRRRLEHLWHNDDPSAR